MTHQLNLPLRTRKKRAPREHPIDCACAPCELAVREALESIETKCAYFDFNTCRAQHCGGYKSAFSGPPFCDACMDLLPDLTKRRLVAEWGKRPMMTITEREHVQKESRTHPGTFKDFYTGQVRQREIYDQEALELLLRRLEIQTAWTLRVIRRSLHLA